MYESFYDLRQKPFQITTDPSFLWMGKKHREALSTLKYGVMDNKGFLLLTGDVGTGKTTLINRLVEDIQDRAYSAKIPDPGLSKYDFFRMVSQYFGLPASIRTKSDFIEPFQRFLSDAHAEKKSVLLLIDEAQRLKHDLMEEIRLLSNLEYKDSKLLNIFFVGQNEFNSILMQPENRALMRRITITYNLDPLNLVETGEYIRHRLRTAGAGYEIFSSSAIEEVYAFSNGYPRQINIICDLAMFFSSQVSQRTISRKVVSQCRERITFPTHTKPAETPKNIRASARTVHYKTPAEKRHFGWRLGQFAAALLIAAALVAALFLGPKMLARNETPAVDEEAMPHAQPALLDDGEPAGVDTKSVVQTTPAAPAPHNTPPARTKPTSPAPNKVPPQSAESEKREEPVDAIDWLLEKRKATAQP